MGKSKTIASPASVAVCMHMHGSFRWHSRALQGYMASRSFFFPAIGSAGAQHGGRYYDSALFIKADSMTLLPIRYSINGQPWSQAINGTPSETLWIACSKLSDDGSPGVQTRCATTEFNQRNSAALACSLWPTRLGCRGL